MSIVLEQYWYETAVFRKYKHAKLSWENSLNYSTWQLIMSFQNVQNVSTKSKFCITRIPQHGINMIHWNLWHTGYNISLQILFNAMWMYVRFFEIKVITCSYYRVTKYHIPNVIEGLNMQSPSFAHLDKCITSLLR
jgi:hypothetical protein